MDLPISLQNARGCSLPSLYETFPLSGWIGADTGQNEEGVKREPTSIQRGWLRLVTALEIRVTQTVALSFVTTNQVPFVFAQFEDFLDTHPHPQKNQSLNVLLQLSQAHRYREVSLDYLKGTLSNRH